MLSQRKASELARADRPIDRQLRQPDAVPSTLARPLAETKKGAPPDRSRRM